MSLEYDVSLHLVCLRNIGLPGPHHDFPEYPGMCNESNGAARPECNKNREVTKLCNFAGRLDLDSLFGKPFVTL